MESRQTRKQLLAKGEIVSGPNERACTDQNFELPAGIYVAMVALFSGFVGVLALAFHAGHMPVVYGIIGVFIAAFFALPAMFVGAGSRMSRGKAMSWSDFSDRGISTATGHSTAREATVLVLLLPFLILCWAIAVVSIAALV